MLRTVGRAARRVHPLTWAVLIAAFVLLNVFAFKVFRVPVDRQYNLDWGASRWIGVAQHPGSIAYFRKSISLDGPPDDAFLQVQATQSYSVYVNGVFVDKTRELFLGGRPNVSNIYDLGALLAQGQNTVSVCAINYDASAPALRGLLGLTYGEQRETFVTDAGWKATSDPSLVQQSCGLFGRTARSSGTPVWTQPAFQDDAWPAPAYVPGVAKTTLAFDPLTYQVPLPKTWAIDGAWTDAYFQTAVNLPDTSEAWLRLSSTGIAETYLNGHLVVEVPARITTDRTNPTPRAAAVTSGIFDVSTYLHRGRNSLAVRVTTLTSRSKANNPKSRPAALALDLLVGPGPGYLVDIAPGASWAVSPSFVPGWATGHGTEAWGQATAAASDLFVAKPPYRVIGTSLEKVDSSEAAITIGLTSLLFLLGCVLAVGLQCRRRRSERAIATAFERVGLAFSGTAALGVLLIGLKLEPLVPRPFPYTSTWLAGLAILPMATFVVMMLPTPGSIAFPLGGAAGRFRRWRGLAVPVTLTALVGLAAYMASYQLDYEAFWQDELSSIYAALGVLQDGIPHLASGFVYPKGELFSYLLAGFIQLFGQDAGGPRIISVVEYVISLPVTFLVGRYFFGKRVGLLATALVVFFPLALLWARSARMYQQAELAVLVVLYLFYKACQPGAKVRYIYLSLGAVVAMYLSHEESFIVLPALLLYFLLSQRLRWVGNVHWWLAGLGASAIILAELLLTVVTHPPALGNDITQRPMVYWTPENLDFYGPLLLDGGRVMAHAFQFGWTTLLALAACAGALFTRNRALRYMSLMFILPLLFLIFAFSLNSDRYLYPIFPMFAFLAAFSIVRAAETISRLGRHVRLTPVARLVTVTAFTALLVTATLQAQVTPFTYFGLATSRLLGLDYHHRYPDYQAAGAYIRDHWQNGDVLITVAPSIEGVYYAEQPTYMIYQGKALYLYEKNTHIVDTLSGSMAILNGRDLAAALNQQHRMWLLSTSYYRSTLPRGFRAVFEGQQTLVYFRDGSNNAVDALPFNATSPGA